MRRLLALSAGLVLAFYASAIPVNVGQIVPSPDGSFSTAYKTGNKDPSPSVLACDITGAPQLIGLNTGTPYTEDFSVYFSGSAKGTVETYEIVTVSGNDAETEGWSLDGDNLEHTALQTGSGVFTIEATITGDIVRCASRQWSFMSPPAGDTTDPVPVTGITTVEGPDEGEFTLSFDQSDDPRSDDGIVGSGVASYLVTHAGGTTPITSGVQAGFTPNWRTNAVEVVDFAPNPSSSQTGRQITLVTAGTGFSAQNDQYYFLPFAVTGGFRLTAKLNSMSGHADTFSNMGLTVSTVNPAASAADNQPRVSTYWQDAGTGFNAVVQTKTRASAGVNATNTASTELAAPDGICIQMARAPGATVVETSWSADCVTWSPIASPTITLPDTVYVGPHATAVSTTPITAIFDWVSLQAYERISAEITAASGNLTVTAIDNEDNDQVSASVAYTSLPGVVAAQKKFRPGHYWMLKKGDTETSNPVTTITNRCTAISDEPELEGVMIKIDWDLLETGATEGAATYTFDMLDQIVENCKDVGMSVWLLILDRTFSTNLSTSTCPVPQYLKAHCAPKATGVVLKYWEQYPMDRVIALYTAICERYDDEWYFHGFATEESATSNVASGYGYTPAALVTQLTRMYFEASRACEKTVLLASLNWMTNGTNANFAQLMAAAHYPNALNMGITAPDSCADNPLCPTEADAGTLAYGTTTMQDVYLGVLTGGGLPLKDYRGLGGAGFMTQAAGLDEKTWAINFPYHAILGNHWNFWDNNDTCTTTGCGINHRWTPHVLPELQEGDKEVVTTCPTEWTLACDTAP
jgi:hypothetical protein